jgi:acyl carrier protein
LPEPEHLRATEGGAYVEAQTAVEKLLVGIWSEVLGVEQVGVNDNFFDLGGHSLLATQIISRVREIFGVEIALRKLFEMPTVAALAPGIENAISGGTSPEVPPLVRVNRDEELPLSFAQQRLWFIDQLEPGNAFYNVRAAVRLSGALSVTALQRTFDEVVRRHEVLRTTFASRAGRLVQVIADAVAVEMPVLDLSSEGEEERERQVRELALEEAVRPFDLSRGPLLRIKLIRLQAEDHVVLLTMHHIVSDAWSIAVLIKEVGALYGAYVRGEESPLIELGVQ